LSFFIALSEIAELLFFVCLRIKVLHVIFRLHVVDRRDGSTENFLRQGDRIRAAAPRAPQVHDREDQASREHGTESPTGRVSYYLVLGWLRVRLNIRLDASNFILSVNDIDDRDLV
jgi:hypothetical protein